MPRGKYVNHKGRSRHFTSPEELQQENEESSSAEESSSGEDEQPRSSNTRGMKCAAPAGKMPTSSEDSEDDQHANKGVSGLIKVANLNRVLNDISKLDLSKETSAQPELSRRDREQLAKQKARERYEKLHAEGKTAQAKADLARLALIKQQRADAAAKREADMKKKAGNEKKTSGNK